MNNVIDKWTKKPSYFDGTFMAYTIYCEGCNMFWEDDECPVCYCEQKYADELEDEEDGDDVC